MIIESLLTADFHEKLDTRFSYIQYFDDLPGQIIFMMTLEVCNNSANLDVKGAKVSFLNLSLSNHPDEM